ncbi:MAG: hypothetical protein ACE5KH_00310 [Candidatus Geothermarchaeales archaeon]
MDRSVLHRKGLARPYLGDVILVVPTIISTSLLATFIVRYLPEVVVGRLQLDASDLRSSDGYVKLWVRNVGSASVVLTTVHAEASDGTVAAVQSDPVRVISPRRVELIQVIPPLQLEAGRTYVITCTGSAGLLKASLRAH